MPRSPGADIERRARFYDLAAALGELGVWIRLHYVYPYPHVDQVVELMADGRVLPYLDIPFQHASARILKLMKRPAAAENTLRADRRLAARRAGHHDSQHLHRRISRRDRAGLRGAARLAAQRAARPRRLLRIFAGRRRGGQRACARRRCPTKSSRSGARASWSSPPRSARSGSQQKVGRTLQVLVDRIDGDVAIARSSERCAGDRRRGAHPATAAA